MDAPGTACCLVVGGECALSSTEEVIPPVIMKGVKENNLAFQNLWGEIVSGSATEFRGPWSGRRRNGRCASRG